MSTARVLPLIAFACLTLLPARADDAAARRAVEDAFQKNLAALKRQDIAALKALRTQNYVLINPDGKREGLAIFVQQVKEEFKEGVKVSSASLKIEKLTTSAKGIEVTCRTTFTATMPDPKGKTHTVEQSAHSRIMFVRGGHKLRKSILLEDPTTKIDGQQPFSAKDADVKAGRI